MSKVFIPEGYQSKLKPYETQAAIAVLRKKFEDRLCAALDLTRVSAPLFVDPETGLNDDLIVEFSILNGFNKTVKRLILGS